MKTFLPTKLRKKKILSQNKIKQINTARLDDYRNWEKKREEFKKQHENENIELFNELKESNDRALRAETQLEKCPQKILPPPPITHSQLRE